jgi:transglutaminase-like putative cysteine protease
MIFKTTFLALAAAITVVDGTAVRCGSGENNLGWQLENDYCLYEAFEDARSSMATYLWENIMPYDVPKAISLGFAPQASSSFIDADSKIVAIEEERRSRQLLQTQPCVDGLSDGILNQTLHYSLMAKSIYPWADAIPRDVYMEYVVPYAVANEPRTDYRQLLFDSLRDSLKDWERSSDSEFQVPEQDDIQATMKQVVKLINTRLWSILGRPDKPIVFQAGLTPRIYDPLSVIAYGHSSCTGLAVLLVAALRTVGIAARLAGTPAWWGDEENGNHSWVEVYLPDENGGQWMFLEPTPGIAEGDEDTADADDLDRDPCKRWFCKADHFNGTTRVYATRFKRDDSNEFYPMAWGVGDKGVVGLDRSDLYTSTCGGCH